MRRERKQSEDEEKKEDNFECVGGFNFLSRVLCTVSRPCANVDNLPRNRMFGACSDYQIGD